MGRLNKNISELLKWSSFLKSHKNFNRFDQELEVIQKLEKKIRKTHFRGCVIISITHCGLFRKGRFYLKLVDFEWKVEQRGQKTAKKHLYEKGDLKLSAFVAIFGKAVIPVLIG